MRECFQISLYCRCWCRLRQSWHPSSVTSPLKTTTFFLGNIRYYPQCMGLITHQNTVCCHSSGVQGHVWHTCTTSICIRQKQFLPKIKEALEAPATASHRCGSMFGHSVDMFRENAPHENGVPSVCPCMSSNDKQDKVNRDF